ncbi:MAG TPA: hypothetical protein VGB91_12280 [Rhizomicrobium sp.]
MKAGKLAALAALVVSIAWPSASFAAGNGCFYSSEFQGWKAPDAKTIYVRVGLQRYFRLDLGNSCPALLWPDTHLITTVTGSNLICHPVDWDIKLGQSGGGGGIVGACIVSKMTELTPQDVAAIPPKFKP